VCVCVSNSRNRHSAAEDCWRDGEGVRVNCRYALQCSVRYDVRIYGLVDTENVCLCGVCVCVLEHKRRTSTQAKPQK